MIIKVQERASFFMRKIQVEPIKKRRDLNYETPTQYSTRIYIITL